MEKYINVKIDIFTSLEIYIFSSSLSSLSSSTSSWSHHHDHHEFISVIISITLLDSILFSIYLKSNYLNLNNNLIWLLLMFQTYIINIWWWLQLTWCFFLLDLLSGNWFKQQIWNSMINWLFEKQKQMISIDFYYFEWWND